MLSNFSFLDDLIPKEEYQSPLSSAEIDKLKQEEAVDTLKEGMTTEEKEEFVEAEKSFSKMDMSTVQWSTVERSKQYNCVIVNRQIMGQGGMPLVYHKKLQAETIEIAKENNGHLIRADKGIIDFLKVSDLKDCSVILVHRAKSLKQILDQQRRDLWAESEKDKVPRQISIVYSNSTVKNFTLVADSTDRNETIGKIYEILNGVKTEHEPVSVFEDNKFIVFPSKYIFGLGNLEVINAIGIIERECDRLRAGEGKPPIGANKYFVCNQDEPYAQELLRVILKGEDKKQSQSTKE